MAMDIADNGNPAAPGARGSVRIVALGCAKNLVDTERVAGNFAREGWRLVSDGPADAVVVTTCGFIGPSAQQSVDTLLEEIEAKKRGETRMVVAAGCLPDRYREELVGEMDELDLIVGVREMTGLPQMVRTWFTDRTRRWEFSSRALNEPVAGERLIAGPPWRSYLKISDGCDNGCTFCVIPRIRGAHRSVSIDDLVAEADYLAENGSVELSLVAQDLTSYGLDIYGEKRLPELLRRLAAVDGIRWIRLLYAHPAHLDDAMIEAMAEIPAVVPYIDIPFQHISDPMLATMNRHLDRAGHERLLAKLRVAMPDIAIRTTFIVGSPRETEADFEELMDFVREQRFDNLGVFPYSREENTPAYRFDGQVDEEIANERMDRLMTLQQGISREILASRRGLTLPVIVEEELAATGDDRYTHVGRTIAQAPEIDGVTYLHAPEGTDIRLGDIVPAKVEDSTEYDLFAAIV
ncbi:30S ribosomal protein S12 methylthiotransferase RimO [bacterium]|nr:30S ribosomal protein S12 methylthiotransferase RimO [bacterium]